MRNRSPSLPTETRTPRPRHPHRAPRRLALLAGAGCVVAALGACGDGDLADDPSSAGTKAGADRTAAADGLYDRELAFLAQEGRRALFFTSRADMRGGGGEVRAQAWAEVGRGWEALLDESKEFAELRDPWRVFPLGSARLLVEDDGALRALVLPGPRGGFELRPVSPPTELSATGARLSVREATLTSSEDSIAGILVDAMVAFADPDSAGSSIEAVLTAPSGPVVVIAGGEDRGPLLVADVGGVEMLETEVRIEPGDRAGEWRVFSADTSVVGTLRATAEEAPASTALLAVVAGRIALAGTLYPLAGVLRVPSR